jgi:hypothetical protein
VIAVNVSYSMDMDQLAVQRERYAQAIISKEFLQALKTGPNGKVAVTYFEWSASRSERVAGRVLGRTTCGIMRYSEFAVKTP